MRFSQFQGLLYCFLFGCSSSVFADLIWPTPNPAFQCGESIKAFIQPTASGKIKSGLFGCVRNNGYRFHEGLDLYPIKRNEKGKVLDHVYAALPGRVVYVNRVAEHSSYGRYVVIEHDLEVPAFHTLYAHLAITAEGILTGARVKSGTVLGIIGHSANYRIPNSRAHLHFEIGFRLTNDFQSWYDQQKFSSKNWHGMWNGMNLLSIDPLGFYKFVRSGKAKNLREYIKTIPAVARIRIHTSKIPDFVQNYPALVTSLYGDNTVVAWDVAFTRYGLPKEWTPRFANEKLLGQAGVVKVLAYDQKHLKQSCHRVLDPGIKYPAISEETLSTLHKLFDFK